MEITEQTHKILNFSETALKDMELAARTCYKSEKRITTSSASKLITFLKEKGHGAMLEFGDATVKFVTDRGVTHEIVRHRLCSFAQESTRYVDYSPTKSEGEVEIQFIRPVWTKEDLIGFFYTWDRIKDINSFIRKDELEWIEAMKTAEDKYRRMRYLGRAPQDARTVLPNSLKTEIVVKANFREWVHIFNLRTNPKAHPQMVALMRPVQEEFARRVPEIFG